MTIGTARQKWIKEYEYFACDDVDCGRPFGYADLWHSILFLLYKSAEWLYYKKEDAATALETCLLTKICFKKNATIRYNNVKKV